MGIDVPESLVLLAEVAGELHQYQMFEDIGVVTGVESVAIAEHRSMPPRARGSSYRVSPRQAHYSGTWTFPSVLNW